MELLENLKPGTLFKFVDKKTIYRIIAAQHLYVQYENPKRKNSIWEIGSHQKKFNQPVEIVAQ